MYCPNCGEELQSGAKFCGICGARIREFKPEFAPGAQGNAAKQPSLQVPQASPVSQPSSIIPVPPAQTPVPSQDPVISRAPELGGAPRRIKDDRNVLVVLLLSIVTCSLYLFYNVYSMAQDMNTMCSDDDENTGGLLVYILLSFLTCGIYGLYWEYKLGNRIAINAPRYGFTVAENGTTILLWRILGVFLCGLGSIYGMHLLLRNMNKLARAYNAAHGF